MLISKFDTTDIERKVLAFEKQHNIVLPEQYKAFLLKYNGGYTPKTSCGIKKISSDVRAFYGIDNEDYPLECYGLEDWLEKNLLPIAGDVFGNYYMIGLEDKRLGKIYFSDHEKGFRLYIAANDLKGFIAACTSERVDDKPIRSIKEREESMIAKGRGHLVTDGLREVWQEEIDFFEKIVQEEVILE